MNRKSAVVTGEPGAAEFERRIESLTVNLLECYEELDLIYRLSRRLRSTLDAQESAEAILAEAMEIFEADFGWITPADEVPPIFATRLLGAEPRAVESLRGAVMGDLLARGKSRIFESLRQEPGLEGLGLPDSLLCSVVKTEGRVYGALSVGRGGAGRPFTARDLKLCDVLASQAAAGMERWLLQQKRLEEEAALIRMEEEMRLAREIQTSLLPSGPPRVSGYDIACRGVPAQSVGGDYYDFIPIGDDRLGLCIADVTGHGMPAALLMANLQATIRCQALSALSPAECLRRSNRLLYRNTDASRFASCFYGILDAATGVVTYSNAGHNHPLVFSRDGASVPLDRGGLILGVNEEPGYEEGAITLERGQLLVLYSDGVTECFDGDGREFGVEGLEAAVARGRHGTAANLLDGILRAVDAHRGGRPQADDVTLAVLRRL